MLAHKWTHPDLACPIYLSTGDYAPVEFLLPESDRHLLRAEGVQLTDEEFENLSRQLPPMPAFNSEVEDDEDAPSPEVADTGAPADAAAVDQRARVLSGIMPTSPWRRVLRDLLRSGLTYGDAIDTATLEKGFGVTRDHVDFHFALLRVRSFLFRQFGFMITCRGQQGERYLIMRAGQTPDVAEGFSRSATRQLANGIHVCRKVDRTLLTKEETRRLDSVAEKLALKTVLLNKAEQAERVLGESVAGRLLLTAQENA